MTDGASGKGNFRINSPRFFEYIYERSPISYCIVDLDGKILDYNKSFLNLVGERKRNDLVGQPIFLYDAGVNQHTLRNVFEQCKENEKTKIQLAWLKRDSATVLPISAICDPLIEEDDDINNSNGNDDKRKIIGYIFALSDWSEPYKINEEAELANEALRKKEKLKNEFIAIASHELRTPIQPILGYAFLAKTGKISNEKAWDAVLREARRLQQLANDILDVSRIESGNIAYEFRKVSIKEVIESVVNSLRPNASPTVFFETSIDESNGDVMVEMDKPRMTQVLINIIGNALKFTPNGFVKVEAKAFPEKNRYMIKVSDSGGGIPEGILPSLFKTFATKSVNQAIHGTGLGLFISKAIVNAHNGMIYVYNENMGAVVTIQIPITRSV